MPASRLFTNSLTIPARLPMAMLYLAATATICDPTHPENLLASEASPIFGTQSDGDPLSRGGDLDTLLLTGIGHIRNGRALHVAFPAEVVELGSPMHRAAIVPHDEVVHSPAVSVDKLPLCRVGDELINQHAALVLRHAKDTT